MATYITGALTAGGWWMHGDSGSGWWMGGMMIWMVLFWAAVIWGIVRLVRVGLDRQPRGGPDALAILDRRFAEGAISLDEYRERRAALVDDLVRRPKTDVAPRRRLEQ